MSDPAATAGGLRLKDRPRWGVRALRWRLVVVLALAGGLAWSGSRRVPSGPAAGTLLIGGQPSKQAVETTLRVGTFNIHGGRGRDDRCDIRRTAESLAGLDVVGLNEVHGPWFWQAEDQAAQLGRHLHASWLFAPTEKRWWHYEFGNGLLATYPVRFWQRIPLPRKYGKSYRNLLLAEVDVGELTVRVVVTHIDRSDARERQEQLRTAAGFFLSLAEPAVLMGDFNTKADEPEMRRLLSSPGVRDPLAELLGEANPVRIDWLLVRGLTAVKAGLTDEGASDHPHVWAEFSLPIRPTVQAAMRPADPVR